MEGNSKKTEDVQQAQEFIAEANKKMTRIAQEFATGDINRKQFQHLYDRYQRQIMMVANLLAESKPEAWREAINENSEAETTLTIKKTLTALILGYSTYSNLSSMPIETRGDFSVDAELIVPMLSSYRSATAEIFQANVRSTQLENGHWLYFFGGQNTTLIVLFSLEPAANQLPMVQKAHEDYEIANETVLKKSVVKEVPMPFYTLVGKLDFVSDHLTSEEEPGT
jgi:hypothetical protein